MEKKSIKKKVTSLRAANAIWEVFKCLREKKSSYVKLECGVECLLSTLCNFLLKGQVDCHPQADVSCALCLVILFNFFLFQTERYNVQSFTGMPPYINLPKLRDYTRCNVRG